MNLFLIFFEVEWLKIILLISGTAVFIVGGAYVFLRVFAHLVNRKSDTWEGTAAELGLQIDRTDSWIAKRLEGVHQDFKIRVRTFVVGTGENSSINIVSCEAFFTHPLSFRFELEARAVLQRLASSILFGEDVQIGFEEFDKAFHIETSVPSELRNLLVFEMLDGKSPSLLTDLIAVKKRRVNIKITETSTLVAGRAEIDDATLIKTIMDDAVYLAARFQAANQRIAPV